MIELNGLTKYYRKNVPGMVDVSLSIQKGEIFGFIGPNGAGKSTTVRTLLNLIYPTSGSATIDGKDIVNDAKWIRKHVGYIPSEVHFYASMDVQSFLDFSGRFFDVEFKTRQKELVELFDLDVSRKIEALSFGNKKKVAIVAALQHQPDVLILDEPTSGLDPLHQQAFFDALLKEKKRGTTIFFSSHILSEVEKICDRVGVIKDGKLIQVSPIETLRKSTVKRVRATVQEPFESRSKHIKDLSVDGAHVSFVYTGPVKQLLKVLEAQTLQDVTIEDPSLEEIFMHVYERSAA